MAFETFYLTKTGERYLAKVQAGAVLRFTKSMGGQGDFPDSASVSELTGLVEPILDLPICHIKTNKNTAIIRVSFSNRTAGGGIRPPFYLREVGLFAKIQDDPDAPEALFAYANSNLNANQKERGDYIPGTLTEFLFNWIIETGNAQNVTVNLDESLIYIRQNDDLRNNAVTFSIPLNRALPQSGELLSTQMGKVTKYLDDLHSVAFSGSYTDLKDKPGSAAPIAHKNSHAVGGSDALSPGDLGIFSASTTRSGLVSLSSATDSTSESAAATPKSVKAAYDRANEAFTQVDNYLTKSAAVIGTSKPPILNDSLMSLSSMRNVLARKLTNKGVPSTQNETLYDLVNKVETIVQGGMFISSAFSFHINPPGESSHALDVGSDKFTYLYMSNIELDQSYNGTRCRYSVLYRFGKDQSPITLQAMCAETNNDCVVTTKPSDGFYTYYICSNGLVQQKCILTVKYEGNTLNFIAKNDGMDTTAMRVIMFR